ncbi:Solute carrier 49 member 4 [Chamberlinius hualienensis]
MSSSSPNNDYYPSETSPLSPLLTNANEEVEIAIHYPFTEVKVYKRRWIILSAFSLLGFIQGAIWNTWGPISSSAKIVFPQWTDATIALLSNWGNICYVIFLLPVVWVMDTKGLRKSTLLAALLVFIGAGIRCFTMYPGVETWLIHAGHFINGIAGIVVFAGPPQVSAAWFPPNQRTTATGLIYVVGTLGIAAGSLFPPLIVEEITPAQASKHNLEGQILKLMYLQFLFAALMFVWILIYFPAKPDYPPSITASVDRVSFTRGLQMSFRNKNVWLVGLAFGMSTAVCSCWVTVVHINLEVLGISQTEAGWIGCYILIGSCTGSFISSRLCDQSYQPIYAQSRLRLRHNYVKKCSTQLRQIFEILLEMLIDCIGGRMKFFLFVGLVGSTIFFIWFAGICLKVFPATKLALYTSVVAGGAFNGGLQPIFMELGAEVAYPIGEAVVGGFLTGVFNVIGTIFLLLFFIPNIGYIWMNWCLIGSTVIAIPVLFFVREHYARSAVDSQNVPDRLCN